MSRVEMEIIFAKDPACLRSHLRDALQQGNLRDMRAIILGTAYQIPDFVEKNQDPMNPNIFGSSQVPIRELAKLRAGWVESMDIITSSPASSKLKNILVRCMQILQDITADWNLNLLSGSFNIEHIHKGRAELKKLAGLIHDTHYM